MEDLSFNDVDSVSRNQSSLIGGPALHGGLTTFMNHQLSAAQKRAAFESYQSNNGYVLFDLTKITNSAADNHRELVNATSFAIYFPLWLILFITIIILMAYDFLSVYVGLYLLLIFSMILYVASVIYRVRVLNTVTATTNTINNDIQRNKSDFDESVIQLPNNIVNMSHTLNGVSSACSFEDSSFPSSF